MHQRVILAYSLYRQMPKKISAQYLGIWTSLLASIWQNLNVPVNLQLYLSTVNALLNQT